MAVDDGVYPFPLASNVVPMHPHRLAQATRDAEMLEAIEQRLREGSPRSGARHVRLTDSVQVGENEFEDPADGIWAMSLRTRALAFGRALLHGLAGSAASIAIAVFALSYFAAAFVSGAGQ
jgi:hypothetical protein